MTEPTSEPTPVTPAVIRDRERNMRRAERRRYAFPVTSAFRNGQWHTIVQHAPTMDWYASLGFHVSGVNTAQHGGRHG